MDAGIGLDLRLASECGLRIAWFHIDHLQRMPIAIEIDERQGTGMKSFIGALSVMCALVIAGWSSAQESSISWNSFAIQMQPSSQVQKPPVVTGISMQSNGPLTAIVGDDHLVNIYNRETSQFVRQIDTHTDWVRTAQFSPDGSHLVTAGNDRHILIWNVSDLSRPIHTITHEEAIAAVAFSGDSRSVAAVGFEKSLHIYDVASGTLIREIKCPCVDMRAVAFTDDSQMIAAGGRNGIVKVWEAASGRVVSEQKLHTQRIRHMVFLPDHRLVTCSDDREVKISDVLGGGLSFSLPRHGGKLYTLCLLDDNLLATAGSDNLIYVWNLVDRTPLGQLKGHSGTVSCLDYQRGTLVSGSYDTHVRFWTTEKIARSDEDIFRR